MLRCFKVHYQEELLKSFTRVAGFPDIVLAPHAQSMEVRRFAELTMKIARRGVERPCVPGVEDLERLDTNHLGPILTILSRCHTPSSCDEQLVPLIAEASLRTSLVDGYRELFLKLQVEAANSGIALPGFRRLCVFNAMRYSKSVPLLYRYNMIAHCSQIVAQANGEEAGFEMMQAWVDKLSDEARMVYSDSRQFDCLLWKHGQLEVYFDAALDRWRVEDHDAVSNIAFGDIEKIPRVQPLMECWGAHAITRCGHWSEHESEP